VKNLIWELLPALVVIGGGLLAVLIRRNYVRAAKGTAQVTASTVVTLTRIAASSVTMVIQTTRYATAEFSRTLYRIDAVAPKALDVGILVWLALDLAVGFLAGVSKLPHLGLATSITIVSIYLMGLGVLCALTLAKVSRAYEESQ